MRQPIPFDDAFTALTGNSPFPWQQALYERIVRGADHIPSSCDLPTGLGKTSVIAIWLVALANAPHKVPRRLVYVVNRRTVVDQSTGEAKNLRNALLDPGDSEILKELAKRLGALGANADGCPLAISTLRGQFADNGEWRADPARPAIIVGTVDMIGSRLLFSGYGAGFKTRPLHAGFLGQDVLLVHDEAHLEPAFQKLLIAIREEQQRCHEFRPFHVMALSATARGGEQSIELLTNEEQNPPESIPEPPTEPIHHVWRRLTAKKGLKFIKAKWDEIAVDIGKIALRYKSSAKAILVFVRAVDDVNKVQGVLTDKKEGVAADQVQVLTGTQRGLERDQLVAEDPIYRRFLLRDLPDGKTVYLICTSAGEVGIDISADHLICDLTTLDRMTQRLGRVNRRGGGQAEIDVVYETDRDPKRSDNDFEIARWATFAVLQKLAKCDWDVERRDASPLALRRLALTDEERKAAFAPEPKQLPTSDILFDRWALTSIRDKLPGRPPVAAYLHGIEPWEPPETHVAWREEVTPITGGLLDSYGAQDLLDDYPLKPHELLRDRTDRVVKELAKLVKRLADSGSVDELSAWVVNDDGTVEIHPLAELVAKDKQKRPLMNIEGRIVLLPPRAGGLSQQGMLDGNSEFTDERQGDFDVADEWFADAQRTVRRRRRVWGDPQFDDETENMRLIRTVEVLRDGADDDADPQRWHWYELPQAADDDGSQGATEPVEWQDHTNDVVAIATRTVAKLQLADELQRAVVLAAEFHDLGKKRVRWQRGIGNPEPTHWLAKAARGMRRLELGNDYRHEFGSLLDALDHAQGFLPRLRELSREMQDLVLHLIAAHHGRARPHFDQAMDPDSAPSRWTEAAREVPRRYARLQRKYGRWGLAYLESLLRAADYAASARAPTRVAHKRQDKK